MGIPIDSDENVIVSKPRESRGGAFAPSDMSLIRTALVEYTKSHNLDDSDQRRVTNLLHRIARIN